LEGLSEGSSDGMLVGALGELVGMGEIVGREEIEGCDVGAEDGAGEIVGLALGDAVGLGVTKRSHSVVDVSTQVGVNVWNCAVVSNTERNGQRLPLLFLAKLSSLLKVLPKTTTSDAPTKLSMKHVLRIFTGPSDSTM